MQSKVEILMHPVRMKICLALLNNKENGLTPLEMVKVIKDVPQATLYRHIQVMADANIIYVLKEEKVKSVTEKYYAINETEARLDKSQWESISKEEKLNFFSSFQLLMLSRFQSYLEGVEDQTTPKEESVFSVIEMNLDENQYKEFLDELNQLITKYHDTMRKNNKKDTATRTVGITVIPN